MGDLMITDLGQDQLIVGLHLVEWRRDDLRVERCLELLQRLGVVLHADIAFTEIGSERGRDTEIGKHGSCHHDASRCASPFEDVSPGKSRCRCHFV